MRLSTFFTYVALLALLHPSPASADTFGSGENQFDIEFVTIGSPGNPPDDPPNTAGAVDYVYRIGKYEVSEQMIEKANALSALSGNPLGITIDTRGPDKPATSVTWFEAARFVNWLNTSTGHAPAYKFDEDGDFQLWQENDPGYNPDNLFRNARAFYFLPSVDQWHKAAYYDPVSETYFDYPTGSDTPPDGIDFPGDTVFDAVFFDGASSDGPNDITDVGLLSPFGTAGQGGNVDEWEETRFERQNDSATSDRAFRGGNWASTSNRLFASNRGDALPFFEGDFIGFRVASIPEPNSVLSLAIGVILVRLIPIRANWAPYRDLPA